MVNANCVAFGEAKFRSRVGTGYCLLIVKAKILIRSYEEDVSTYAHLKCGGITIGYNNLYGIIGM